MKLNIKIYSFFLLAVFLLNGCRNPAYDIDVLFDADVIQYKTTIILKDANGATLPNLNVSVTGADAASIYDFSGTKQIFAPSGVITLGVTPKAVPTAGKTLSFNVIVKGAGYEDKNIPVTISVDQFSQILNVTMLKVAVPTPVTTVVTKDVPLAADGKTTVASTIETPASSTVPQTTTINVAAGTQMRDAAGKVLTGSSLTVRAINYDANDPASIDMFPGGSLSAPDVVGADGTTGSAFFIPAGFANIQMFIDGVEVKTFSTPINISIQVDPTFRPQATNQPIKAGDKLSVYSYDVATGKFNFETIGTAALDSKGKLAVNFPMSHLTIFVVGDVINTEACVEPTFTFVAPWLNDGTQSMNLEILSADGTKSYGKRTIVVSNGLVAKISGLPALATQYRITDNTGKLLAEGALANSCAGTNVTITIGAPTGVPVQNISLILNVNCPGKGLIIVPNFDLFYKPAGAPNGEYKLLGTTENGILKTTALTIGNSYDFRATWKNETKVVGKRKITDLDMSTVVGENDFLGTKSPNYNKSLLIEACKGL
ncbi:hypothetical protein [Pedobacter sp.]|uniref:hypothetical protein n=1 Tax=Pedobacter sp. TaxID=1411316 RepID=UPI003D7FAF5B